MARAREIPLHPSLSFREAAARAVEVRTEEVFEHADRVLDRGDIEGVHDMRVASRRLRAAMEIGKPCFPRADWKRLLREVKHLADALGERRDPDVAIANLGKVASGFGPGDRSGINAYVATLETRQKEANATLERLLHDVGASRLRERLLALAAEARG